MESKNRYKGIIVPVVTPLTPDFNLDEPAVERLFNYLYGFDISPFILGTTGESASLPVRIKEDYVRVACRYKKPGSILYAGISSNVISESIDFAGFCGQYAVDALAAALPSYYALNDGQIRQYFTDLADASPLPIIIYNIPATTHMSIPLSVIEELSYHPNIVATKDSERSEERLKQSLLLWKDRIDFAHFLGWAAQSAEALIGGSAGLIPSTGNLMPEIYSRMQTAVLQGDFTEARNLQKQSDDYGNLYQGGKSLGESLWALKVLMKEKGLCEPVVMPPLQPLSKKEEQLLIQSFHDIKN